MSKANKPAKQRSSPAAGAPRSGGPDARKQPGSDGAVEIDLIGRADALIRVETLDPETREVDVIWAAGAEVKRYDWWEGEHYVETLSMEPSHIRMGRFEAGMSLLDGHQGWSMDDRLGTVIPGSARIENGLGLARVRLSRKERAEELMQDLRDGLPFPVSVGYKIHAYQRTESEGDALARLEAIDWEPFEISAVPIPADPAAHSRSEEEGQSRRVKVAVARRQTNGAAARNQEPEMGNKTGQKPKTNGSAGVRGEGDAAAEDNADEAEAGDGDGEGAGDVAPGEEGNDGERRQPGGQSRTDPAARPPAADVSRVGVELRTAADQAVARERERCNQIRTLGERSNVGREIIDQHIHAGTAMTDFRQVVLDIVVTRQEATAGSPHAPGRTSSENRETRRAAVVNALTHRHAPGTIQLTEAGRNYRGLSLIETARELLREDGVDVRGLSKSEIATRAFHTTSDFPLILQNVIRTSLRAAYEAYPQTFQPFSRQTTAPDFREMKQVSLSEGPRLMKINEHGEYKRGTLRESEQSYAIATYGRIVGVTRQLLINDDLGAFTRIPQLYGGAIAQLESDLVWDEIVQNQEMADGQPLFSAAHGNTTTAEVFSAAALGRLREKITQQKGMDGKTRLSLRPKFLLVGSRLEYLVEQVLGPASLIYPQAPGGVTPESLRKLTPIVEPRLDDMGNGYGYILVADPAQIDTVEYAYLEGEQGAYMETKEGWDVDGMEVKCRLDFGATVQDAKAFAYNEGVQPS